MVLPVQQQTPYVGAVLKKYLRTIRMIEVLGSANASWDYAQGKAAVESMLSAYPEIDGVWSQGGAMTQGAIDAFIAAGRDLVPMTSEGNNGALKAWYEIAITA